MPTCSATALDLAAHPDKHALFERSLQRCADMLDDITPLVAEEFYVRHPAARAQFDRHYPGAHGLREGEMVQQVVFCLMTWFAAPREIEITVLSTFPHHVETLGISPAEFSGFVDAVCSVVGSTIPADAAEERATLDDIVVQFRALVAKGMKLLRVRDQA